MRGLFSSRHWLGVLLFIGLQAAAVSAGAAPASAPQSKAEAARFLSATSFGATTDDIERLSAMRYDAWVDEQLALAPTYHLPQLLAYEKISRAYRLEVWFNSAINGPDQLRQRVAFALSEIFVISDMSPELSNKQLALTAFYDLLVEHAFGNYRDLLEAVTLSPAMGAYLSMLDNQKPDELAGIRADENYAREVMQLMTIGLVELKRNGQAKKGEDGEPIPTFDQNDVEGLARVLTGWSFGGSNTRFGGSPDWDDPMAPYDAYHDTGEKRIVGGVVVPAGGTARADLDIALDALFQHPNVGPFIGRQLIQRLVTSNPSPGYVRRVARVFNDDGHGVRGNLGAVVRAILLDREALQGTARNADFGKPREPLMHLTHLWRAFDAQPYLGPGRYHFVSPESKLGQGPLSSPSVFNFFRPDFAPQGVIADAGLVAPEYQLADEYGAVLVHNQVLQRVFGGWAGREDPTEYHMLMSWDVERALAADPAALVDHLDLLLTGERLPQTFKDQLAAYLGTVGYGSGAETGVARVQRAIALVMSSSFYAVQH